jgi:hypothetical protein
MHVVIGLSVVALCFTRWWCARRGCQLQYRTAGDKSAADSAAAVVERHPRWSNECLKKLQQHARVCADADHLRDTDCKLRCAVTTTATVKNTNLPRIAPCSSCCLITIQAVNRQSHSVVVVWQHLPSCAGDQLPVASRRATQHAPCTH